MCAFPSQLVILSKGKAGAHRRAAMMIILHKGVDIKRIKLADIV